TDSSSRHNQFSRLASKRSTGGNARRWPESRKKCLAISDAESAGNRLHLVQLSPWPVQFGPPRADAWRVRFVARETGNFRRCTDCARGGDQSVSSNGDYLFNLSASLEGDCQSCRGAGVFASRFAGVVPRIGTSLARSRAMERRDAKIRLSRGSPAPDAQLHLEKSIPRRRHQPIVSTRGRGCGFRAAYTHLRKRRRP